MQEYLDKYLRCPRYDEPLTITEFCAALTIAARNFSNEAQQLLMQRTDPVMLATQLQVKNFSDNGFSADGWKPARIAFWANTFKDVPNQARFIDNVMSRGGVLARRSYPLEEVEMSEMVAKPIT